MIIVFIWLYEEVRVFAMVSGKSIHLNKKMQIKVQNKNTASLKINNLGWGQPLGQLEGPKPNVLVKHGC